MVLVALASGQRGGGGKPNKPLPNGRRPGGSGPAGNPPKGPARGAPRGPPRGTPIVKPAPEIPPREPIMSPVDESSSLPSGTFTPEQIFRMLPRNRPRNPRGPSGDVNGKCTNGFLYDVDRAELVTVAL